jgi:hypothetical protein
MATAITATLTSWLRRSTPGCRPGVFHLLVLSGKRHLLHFYASMVSSS